MELAINPVNQTVARALSHRGSLALIDQAVVSGTNFLTGLAVARLCGRVELGIYMLAWTVATMVNEILNAIIVTPYNVISPLMTGQQQTCYRGSMLLHQFVLSGLCASALVVGAFQLRHAAETRELGNLLGVLTGLIIVLVLREFVRRMYFAHLQMIPAVITDSAACTLQLLIVGALGSRHLLSPTSTYLTIAFCSLIPIWTWLRTNRARFSIRFSDAVEDFRKNWKVAKWILGSGVLWAGAMYMYPWLLIWAHGASSTGAWAACYGLVALSNPVLLGFGNYLGPKIALLHGHSGLAEMRAYVWRSSIVFALLLSPLCAVAWLFGNALIGHLYGPSFIGYTTAIRILAVNVLVAGAVFPLSRGFFSMQRADLDLVVNVVAIAILFIFSVTLVRLYGVTGAAIGLALTNGVTALIRAVLFARVTRGANRCLKVEAA